MGSVKSSIHYDARREWNRLEALQAPLPEPVFDTYKQYLRAEQMR